MAFFDEFQHLKIQLEDIKSATDNFSENKVIGNGGFGKVYKGEISHCKGKSTAAFKRLDSRLGQGNPEFWKEIMMLSRYTHENLISLLGYCDEDGEKILIYEHASRGSLDRHLRSTNLTWVQRLKICLAAARGLSYLHDHQGTLQRVLHRDIKSSNILLDENWNAKVSDLGLSKMGPANQKHTVLVSNAVGTPGYCDPLYMEMGFLTKESDVYSFGVVLFEVLCGKLCYEERNGRLEILVRMWKQSYEEKKLDDIIFQDLKQQMDPSSLETFSDIAYQCLQRSREERPLMAYVVKQLEIAVESQHLYEVIEVPKEYEAIIKSAVPALFFRSEEELNMLLSKGILVNGGKTWFSLNENGEHCEMISAAEFLFPIASTNYEDRYFFKENSRFANGSFIALDGRFVAHAKTQFLSPGVTYKVNLVFKFSDAKRNSRKSKLVSLRYRLLGETKSLIHSHLAYGREDEWMMVELFRFTNTMRIVDFDIQFEDIAHGDKFMVEGIEFRPVERGCGIPVKTLGDVMEYPICPGFYSRRGVTALEDETVDIQPISDLDTDWEGKLPDDYRQIIKRSKDSMQWTTKKELYLLFCKGFLIDNGEVWFSLLKNGKKCHMLSARVALYKYDWEWKSLPESRFEQVAFECKRASLYIMNLRSNITLSPGTTYACYLVYNITEYHSKFEAPMEVRRISKDFDHDDIRFIYLVSPQTSISRANNDQNTHNPLDMPKIKGLPQLQNDGWMEVQVWEFQTSINVETTSMMHLNLRHIKEEKLNEIIVQGIEVKPLK